LGAWQTFKTYLRTGVAARERLPSSSWHVLTPSYAIVNERAYIVEGYRKNSAVRACSEYLVRSLSSVPLVGHQQTPEGETELSDSDPLALLLERPGGEEEGSRAAFMREVVLRLWLLGEVICYKVPGARTGNTVELQFLGSSNVEIVRKRSGGRSFVYRPDAHTSIPLRRDEVMFLRFSDPLSPERGVSPLMSAAREADTDNEATDFRKAFFENGAITSGLLSTEMEAEPERLKKWSSDWKRNYSGAKNAGKTPVLAGGLKYQKVGADPGEIALPELTGITEARIHQVFGVPPVLTGSEIGLRRSTYSNYESARTAFWEDTATPMLAVISDWLAEGLTERGDGRKILFDLSGVPALREDSKKLEERYRAALEAGAITVNEYREKIGLDAVPDGDVYLRPTNTEVVEAQ
jgi:HK97 family phage portal protein